VGKVLAKRLRATTSQGADALHRELEESRARAHAGAFIVLMFTMLATYQLALTALPLLPERFQPPSSVLSFLMVVYTAVPIAVALKDSPFSLESYGLSVKHWRKDIYYSFLWTLPVLALLLVVKLVLMRVTPSMVSQSIFDFSAIFVHRPGGFSLGAYLFFLILYIVHSPLQEFIARTGLQGSLQHFAPVSTGQTNWKAILVSNLLFSAAHNYFGFWFCLTVFVPGIYWGWLFSKRPSLIAVSFSHILIGVWGIFVLGLVRAILTH
jgi:membrane protease YdiL (CAAX protease family)